MATNNDTECHPSLRSMSFSEAVTSLYKRSKGLVILVAVKWRGKVFINPVEEVETTGRRTDSKARQLSLGDFEAVFIISPSWQIAWEMMTEKDEEPTSFYDRSDGEMKVEIVDIASIRKVKKLRT